MTFDLAWYGDFFTEEAKLAVSSLDFNLSDIPSFDTLPLGGRLRLAAKNCVKIDPSSWVEGVILEGYKIPFEKVPIQVDAPANPLVTG